MESSVEPSPVAPRPLLVHPGALGDLIRLTAVANRLARRWGAPCDLVARHGAAPSVFAGLGSVAQVWPMPSRGRPFLAAPEQWRFLTWLRRRGPSPVYLMEERVRRRVPWRDETRLEWLLRRAGVGRRWWVVARRHPRRPLEDFVDYGLRLAALDPAAASGAPSPAGPAEPRLAVGDEEHADCRAWLASRGLSTGPQGPPLVLFQVASRNLKRGRWPDDRWRELALRLLTAEPRARVLLLGTTAEAAMTAALAARCADPRVVDVAGEVPLRRLVALADVAHSCVSLDTGPAHAAAARGCPLVVLAGRADPRRNRPHGPGPVRVVTGWPEAAWPDTPQEWVARHRVEAIEVEPVLAAWREVTSAS